MISNWQWILARLSKKLWFRVTLFAIFSVISALLSILFKSDIPEFLSLKVGAEAVDNILNILASSMLAVTTFSLSIMVTAYGSATTNVTPRATQLVVEDVTTQNVLATFIGSFLFSLVGIIALNMGAYDERGRIILFVETLGVIVLILFALFRWIQHLTSLGRVEETTEKVENVAINTFIERAKNPYLGGHPWQIDSVRPQETTAVYSSSIGYVEYIDVARLHALISDLSLHIYLIVQPGCFIHPTQPVMYVTNNEDIELNSKLLETISVSDSRSFTQDPRFCLCVMAEIACRALSPAVNDPGTAIDVIGRGVRVLSEYARHKEKNNEVKYPFLHMVPLQSSDLMEDFFLPIVRDGANLREVQIRLLKALSMLNLGWPEEFAITAKNIAGEIKEYSECSNIIESDKIRILSVYNTLFSMPND